MDFVKVKIDNLIKSETNRGRSKSCTLNGRLQNEFPTETLIPPFSKRTSPKVKKTNDNPNGSKTLPKTNVDSSIRSTSKGNYSVQLQPGQYKVSVRMSSKPKPVCITLTPGKERWTPPKEQLPLLYEDLPTPSSPPSSKRLNKLLHPSTKVSDAAMVSGCEGVSQRIRIVSPKKRQGGTWGESHRHRHGAYHRRMKYRVAERKKTEGNEYYKCEQYRDAIKLYSEAIDLCPECASYYSNRSACHMMLGKFAQALADAREAVRLDASFVKGYIRVAKCNIALGDPNAALSILRQALELEPGNKAVRDEIANANALLRCLEEVEKATMRRDYRTAIYHLDRALDLANGCRALKITKAEYLVYLQRNSEAQEIVNEILQYDSGNIDAIYVRGMCLYYQDNQDAAFTHFQHVLRLAPDHKKAKEIYKKAKLLKVKKEEGNQAFKKGSLREALNIYTEALAIDVHNKTTNSKLYCNRATVKAKLGKLEEAADDCTAAINLNEEYVKAYLRRAKCYQDLGKHEDAVRDYERVLKFDKSQEHKRLLHEAKVQLKCSKRKDYYDILGVTKTASEDDIKKSYKKMALQHHPDRHANASDKEKQEHEIKFKEIGEAYSVLTDAKKKAMYDRGQDINDPDCGFGHDTADPNEVFHAFFSSGNPGFGFGNQGFGGFPGAGYGAGFPGGFQFQFG